MVNKVVYIARFYLCVALQQLTWRNGSFKRRHFFSCCSHDCSRPVAESISLSERSHLDISGGPLENEKKLITLETCHFAHLFDWNCGA